jgi:uncharacterized cupin superfamily protein
MVHPPPDNADASEVVACPDGREAEEAQMDGRIRVVGTIERAGWSDLVDPPGEIPSGGSERSILTSADGRYTTGLWEREPDTWSFERSYHEVAVILAGEADVETPEGDVVTVRAGDVLVTPKGSKGTWRIKEKIVKFYAIYDAPEA